MPDRTRWPPGPRPGPAAARRGCRGRPGRPRTAHGAGPAGTGPSAGAHAARRPPPCGCPCSSATTSRFPPAGRGWTPATPRGGPGTAGATRPAAGRRGAPPARGGFVRSTSTSTRWWCTATTGLGPRCAGSTWPPRRCRSPSLPGWWKPLKSWLMNVGNRGGAADELLTRRRSGTGWPSSVVYFRPPGRPRHPARCCWPWPGARRPRVRSGHPTRAEDAGETAASHQCSPISCSPMPCSPISCSPRQEVTDRQRRHRRRSQRNRAGRRGAGRQLWPVVTFAGSIRNRDERIRLIEVIPVLEIRRSCRRLRWQ